MTPKMPPVEQAFPARVPVKQLNAPCADWKLNSRAWEQMRLLYSGGMEIEARAEEFLKRRPKEPADVYQARVDQFSYENHVGTALDWYLAALFEKPPRVERVDASGASQEKSEDDYYDRFEKNCDRAGTPSIEKFREHFKNLLLFGRSAILIDLPPLGEYATRAEEIAAGASDPYLVCWDPRGVINYSTTREGALEWILFRAREAAQPSPFAKSAFTTCWYYFDRERFARYEMSEREDEKNAKEDAEATLVSSGRHALADERRVPVIFTVVPESLWLMNRAFLVARKHLNTSNALDWALFMSALAMPVIKMDGDFTLTLTEAGHIKLPRDSEFSWTEPEGKSFAHLDTRMVNLTEQVFRAFYLIAQARSTAATPAAQSGVSKQQDMAAPKKVLSLFGDLMRGVIQTVYDALSAARGEDVEWDVRGMEFVEEPPDAAVTMATEARAFGVPSDTFDRELDKLVVQSVLPDANRALKDAIFAEIDKAPTREERESAALAKRAKALGGLTKDEDSKPNPQEEDDAADDE